MAINSLTFNGINSLEYAMYISGDQTFNSAEKDYSKVSVPGRNGDLVFFNKRYKNVIIPYRAILIDNYDEHTENVRSWLLSAAGYCRLEDTYHPNEFRMANFSGPIDFDTQMLEAGETTLNFDCKPQRWLKSGEQPIFIAANHNRSIINPTLFEAKPVLRVYGHGQFNIGTGVISISESDATYIDIDCDIMDCYEGVINRNNEVSVSKWPVLVPGSNSIIISEGSNISSIYVTPRWWMI
jgi:phage-related protein